MNRLNNTSPHTHIHTRSANKFVPYICVYNVLKPITSPRCNTRKPKFLQMVRPRRTPRWQRRRNHRWTGARRARCSAAATCARPTAASWCLPSLAPMNIPRNRTSRATIWGALTVVELKAATITASHLIMVTYITNFNEKNGSAIRHSNKI